MKNYSFIFLGFIWIFLIFGCEDEKIDSDNESIDITTGNVNQSFFYFDLVNNTEVDSADKWHIALETSGIYNMPSILFGNVYVAVYSNILFDDMIEYPDTFMEDYIQNNEFQYEGTNEVLAYDMDIHKVSVANPEYVYVIYDSITAKYFKVQFVEYISGILVFSYNQL